MTRLFQMGRWFGYRDGYDDLCRVWMPEEAQGWYDHIAESIDELRDELARMQSANATPRDFGLKVRGHPDMLVVTARNKMGYRPDPYGAHRTCEPLRGNRASRIGTDATLDANLRAAVRLADDMCDRGKTPRRTERSHSCRAPRA